MKAFNKRIRPNGQTSLFHTRADVNVLMDFCNSLAAKVDELIESNKRLAESSEKMSLIIAEMKRSETDGKASP